VFDPKLFVNPLLLEFPKAPHSNKATRGIHFVYGLPVPYNGVILAVINAALI
jgi:hypothetical protein